MTFDTIFLIVPTNKTIRNVIIMVVKYILSTFQFLIQKLLSLFGFGSKDKDTPTKGNTNSNNSKPAPAPTPSNNDSANAPAVPKEIKPSEHADNAKLKYYEMLRKVIAGAAEDYARNFSKGGSGQGSAELEGGSGGPIIDTEKAKLSDEHSFDPKQHNPELEAIIKYGRPALEVQDEDDEFVLPQEPLFKKAMLTNAKKIKAIGKATGRIDVFLNNVFKHAGTGTLLIFIIIL